MTLSVQVVSSKRQHNDFFDVRRIVYENDPGAVFPMRFMESAMVDTKVHPFYLHAQRELFVCYRDGRPVGRIAAIIDDMHNEHYQEKMGFFGFYECIEEQQVSDRLLETASDWLRERGCTAVRGPVNPSMKSDFGILIEGHGDPPFVMMAYSRPYYQSFVESFGFSKKMDFFALLYDATKYFSEAEVLEAGLEKPTRRVQERYPEIKLTECPKGKFVPIVREINRLGNQVRSEGFGFVPLTDEELSYMIQQLGRVVRRDTLLCAWHGERLVGYCINVPDINWALRKTVGKSDWVRLPQFFYWLRQTRRARVIAIGADTEYRTKGVGALLAFEMRRRGLRMKCFEQWEFSWVAENNVRSLRNIKRTIPIQPYKTYRLYEKPL